MTNLYIKSKEDLNAFPMFVAVDKLFSHVGSAFVFYFISGQESFKPLSLLVDT